MLKNKNICYTTGLLLAFCPLLSQASGISGIASGITGVGEIVARLMLIAAFVMGVGLVVMAITHYFHHRINPKLVPLGIPITYFFIGVTLCVLPFVGRIFEVPTTSPLAEDKKITEKFKQKRKNRRGGKGYTTDLDRPL